VVGILIALLSATGLSVFAINLIVRNLLYICEPSEVLIFAGPKRELESGRTVGYRLVKGGKSLRVPLLERAFRMDLTNTIIELKVINAYSKGGIPLSVEGVANIKIAGEEPTIHNAIERLLGKTRQEVEQLARETLEGNLRGVLASLTPEQVNEDKIAFARSLLDEAEDDLEKLGLVLDNLQIQNISDDVKYLDSIGRKQQAELLRDARIAEARNRAESKIKAAENEKRTALKRIETEEAIARAEAERRLQDALTMRQALVAEAQAQVGAQVAKVSAELEVQQARIDQVRQQLQADVVAPAEAACKQAIAKAKGDAASIVEDGRAQAAGIEELAKSWASAGPSAREIFLFQKLDVLLQALVSTVPEVTVQNVTVIDGASDSAAARVASLSEQLRHATGIDLPAAFARWLGSDAPPNPETAPALAAAIAPTILDHDLTDGRTAKPEELRDRLQTLFTGASAMGTDRADLEPLLQEAIAASPKFKKQLKRALKAGGQEAIATVLSNPFIRISTAAVTAWLQED